MSFSFLHDCRNSKSSKGFLYSKSNFSNFRTFLTRAAEHMGISNLTGKHLKCVKQSAVSDHLLECNCSIDFDHFDILASDANRFKLLIIGKSETSKSLRKTWIS